MSEKKKIVKVYKEKIKKYINFSKAYFEKDDPKISDEKFDFLKKELLELEKKYPFLKLNKGVENIIGFKPSEKFQKIKHSKKMLSLGNAFSKEDMIDFEKKIKNFLNTSKEIELSSEPKIDGISASLRYVDANLVYGLSKRGIYGEKLLKIY